MKQVATLETGSVKIPLPHGGAVLAVLTRIHITGGSADVTKHIKDVHIRPVVVRRLLEELIDRGFPGYAKVYTKEEVRATLREQYGDDETAEFVPKEVRREIERAATSGRNKRRQDWDKNATPVEPAMPPTDAFGAARPQETVAERHSDTGREMNASMAFAMSRFGNSVLDVQTGSEMVDQWKPQYLGLAAPFTM